MALKESIATLIATDTTLNTEVEQLIADSAGGPGRIAEAVRAALAARDADEADITAAVDAANTAAQTEVDNIHNVLNPAPASEPTA